MRIIDIDEKDKNKGRVAQDGDVFRFRTTLMDAVPPEYRRAVQLADATNRNEKFDAARHRPGPVSVVDAQKRDAAYDARCQRLSDAWRHAPPLEPTQVADAAAMSSQPVNDGHAARLRREQRMRDAWKGGAS